MARSILVGEVRTGRRITQIPVSAASWSAVHRGVGEATADIPLDAEEFRRIERTYVGGLYPGDGVFPSDHTYPEAATPLWRPGDGLRPEFLSAIEPARCFMAILEGDTVLEAGPIWAHEYDAATGVLRVKAAGLRSIFDHRFVMGVIAGTGWAEWQATYAGLSLGTIAKRLVQLAMSHAGGSLPIVLPPDVTAADDDNHRRTYRGHELATVQQRLEQISGVLSGPDTAFEPRLTVDRMGVEWVMRTGTEADPMLHQAGDDHVWDFQVPQGGVSGLSVSRDATGLASRSWATDGGADEALLMKRADDASLIGAGFPLLEVSEARPGVTNPATLQAWADGNLAASRRPWMTWTATVRADASPLLGTYRPGDWAKVWVPKDHPYLSLLIPRGVHRARILSISGDLGDDVKLTMMPVMEA